jgi:hypothetical protein
MKRLSILAAIFMAIASLLGACATKTVQAVVPAPAAPAQPEPAIAALVPVAPPASGTDAPKIEMSAVNPDADGFWPAPGSRSSSIAISILIGNAKDLSSWQLDIVPAGPNAAASSPVRSFAGSVGDRPASISWDGRGADGKLVPQGMYIARLSAQYAGGKLPRLTLLSRSFALSLSPPDPLLVVDPAHLEPSESGVKAPLSFEIDGRPALAGLDSWKLDLVGPDGRLFRSFEGAWPSRGSPAPFSWDGSSDSGAFVQPGARYAAILSLRDIYGNAASTQVSVAVANLPYAPERSSVQPWTSGFSPNGDKVMDEMDFTLVFGQRASVRSWRLEIAHAEKGLVRVYKGSAPDLPDSLSWDGTMATGNPAPEGRYIATLSIDYGSSFSPTVVRSPPFILDVTSPSLSFSSTPALFSPGPDAAGGEDSVLSMNLSASSPLARVTDWSVEIIDPGDHVFARLGGAWPVSGVLAPATWDGIGSDGSLVESAETYRLVARVRDEFGNSSMDESKVETDILVVKDGDRYRVDVASIVFKGYTDDYQDLPPEQAARNLLTLDRLATKFAKFPEYRIRLVGHAVMVNWDDPNLGGPEEEKILLPLSRARAAAIAKALSARGIDAGRMTVEGVGSSRQVVPDSDIVNRWKNRRVEFYLEKP